ncbi:hypothetical protein ACLOJK_037498 [Asimina triloba]
MACLSHLPELLDLHFRSLAARLILDEALLLDVIRRGLNATAGSGGMSRPESLAMGGSSRWWSTWMGLVHLLFDLGLIAHVCLLLARWMRNGFGTQAGRDLA